MRENFLEKLPFSRYSDVSVVQTARWLTLSITTRRRAPPWPFWARRYPFPCYLCNKFGGATLSLLCYSSYLSAALYVMECCPIFFFSIFFLANYLICFLEMFPPDKKKKCSIPDWILIFIHHQRLK